MRLGNPDAAVQAYALAVELDPDNGQAHGYLADAYEQLGRPLPAQRHRQRARQLGHY